MKLFRHFLFLVVVLGIQPLFAQLSSKHYLPPLKQLAASYVDGQTIYLSTPETTAFDVNVYQGTSTIPTTLSISNSSPGIYNPPGGASSSQNGNNNTSLVTGANTGIVLTTAGFRFEAPSGKKFYVNWRASNLSQAGSLVSTGEAGLGTDFRWGGIPFETPFNYFSIVNSVIGIMATENNTHVSIYGYNTNCTFTKGNFTTGTNSITDDIINITLNVGETFVLEAIPNSTTSPNNNGWVGATISSDKKIAINQGHMGLSLTGNVDISMTQLTPTAGLGKEYAFIRGSGLDFAEFPVIIATQNNTEVFVNNEVTPIATLNNGQWFKIPASKYSQFGGTGNLNGANMYVRTTKDVYAFQCISVDNGTAPPTLDAFQCAPLNCLLDGGVNKIPDILKRGGTNTDLSSVAIMLVVSSAITTNNIIVKHGVGGITTVPTATLNSNRKTISGTTDWVTYYIPGISGDVSVQANGPVAVAYLGIQGAAGVAGYFSGFGSIPTISVQTSGNGCLPNTTLNAPTGFNSYIWYKNGTVIPNVTTNTYTPTSIGDYNVEVTNGLCNFLTPVKTVFDCNPEVVVKTTASRKYLLAGETTTFTISVKVYSDNVAQNVQLSNLLPAHLDYTSSTMTKGTFTGSGSNYTWNVGNMSNGEENILTVVATAQTVNTAYSENYVTNNTQTFSSGIEVNSITDDKTENVVIYPGCSSSLAGTITGGLTHCSTTNSTNLTVTNAVGDLQWQSSTDNINFADIIGETASTLVVTNLATTTYYRVKTSIGACIEYAIAVIITVAPVSNLSAITGPNTINLAVATTYTNDTTGGTWTSSNTSIASVNGIGEVFGYISGNVNITYTYTSINGCSNSVSKAVEILQIAALSMNGELITTPNLVTNENGAQGYGIGRGKNGELINVPTTAVVTTGTVSVSGNTATISSRLNATGGITVSEMGICYGTTALPTIANTKITSTSALGNFATTIPNLINNTTYYVRAYATNALGTTYGEQVSFTP